MATQALNLELNKPDQQESQEPTRDAPVTAKDDFGGLTKEEVCQLLAEVKKLKQSWFWERQAIVARVLEAFEFFKGNHFFGFYPGSLQMFDAFQQYSTWTGQGQGGGKQDEDLSLYQWATNFYQMLCFAFIAALSIEIPRTEFTPGNAEEEEDRETAKAATTAQTIIEKKNDARILHKQKLFNFWTGGCYFEHTRFVVDSGQFRSHKETVLKASQGEILPDRYTCSNCGATVPMNAIQGQDMMACPKCHAPLQESGFFPSEQGETPVAEIKEDVPNGMVMQSVYGTMHVDVKPKAANLRETPILDLEMEVSLGWLRSTFPVFYEQLQEGMGADDSTTLMTRQARQIALTGAVTPARYNYTFQQDPTYSRTWIQDWAFSYLDDQKLAAKYKKLFPQGCMIAHVGDLPLQVRPECLTDHWTWAGTVSEHLGMYPSPVGEAAIPVQKRFNDMANLVHEYMERLACGIVLVNAAYLDAAQMNRKGLLPGVLNPIALKKGQALQDLHNIIVQFESTIEPKIIEYLQSLKFDMQLLVGTPPQIFGGAGDPNIQTARGQNQQLQTARGKLNHFWDQIRVQEAKAAEQSIMIAGEKMTEPWWDVVSDKTEQFRNEYVRPEEMKGSVHAQPEEDQGFPMTAEEIQAFWEKILESQNKIIAEMLFDEPKNVDAAVRAFGIKGLVAPGQEMEDKALWYIDQLMQSAPTIEQTPQGAVEVPTIEPDRFLDDLPSLQKIIRTWASEHFDKLAENPDGKRNLLAFFKLCVEYDHMNQAAMNQGQQDALPAGHPAKVPQLPQQTDRVQ